MRIWSMLVVLLMAVTAAAGLPFVRAERQSAVYSRGEWIVFKVTGDRTGVTYRVNDGATVTKPLPLPAEIRCQAKTPGFILITVFGPKGADGKAERTSAGAAVEPEKIRPGTTRPADFDAYWNEEVKKLRSSPLVIKEEPVDAKFLPKGITAYSVTITRGDVTATGFVAFPADAKPKSLNGCLTFLGASQVNADLRDAVRWAERRRALTFNLNFQGLPNEWPKTEQSYRERRAKIGAYYHRETETKEAYPMRKIFLRTVLAAEYLMQRPEYNGKKLAALGGSLGGCQSLVCAALVPQVTFCISQATAMCDHFGRKAGHLAGWPELLRNARSSEGIAPYFDVVNFVHRVKCPVYMSVGFVDTVCPPASTYAAYNTLTTPKQMAHTVTGGHGGRIDKKDSDVFLLWHDELSRYLAR